VRVKESGSRSIACQTADLADCAHPPLTAACLHPPGDCCDLCCGCRCFEDTCCGTASCCWTGREDEPLDDQTVVM
jgi:hypothetical protein